MKIHSATIKEVGSCADGILTFFIIAIYLQAFYNPINFIIFLLSYFNKLITIKMV